jgi:Restriction endonuclease NotI
VITGAMTFVWEFLSIRSISARQKSFTLGVKFGTREFVPDLAPQRNAPVFRRWGTRFFVVVDQPFFTALPRIRRVEGKENSEITWLVYELNRNASGVGYSMSTPDVIFTLWDDVLTALREGEAPQQSEVLAEIETRLPQLRSFET